MNAMSTEMHGVNRTKQYIQMKIKKVNDCCTSPVAKNQRVRASLSPAGIHFLKRVSCFEITGSLIARRWSDRLRDIREY